MLIAGMFYACSHNPGSSSNEKELTDYNPQISENQMIIATDMENVGALPSYWRNGFSVYRMDEIPAHSGQYAVKVTEEHQYSLTFREIFKNLNEKLPTRVIFTGWYYFTEPNENAGLIMEINDSDTSYIWKAYNLANVNPAVNQWNEFNAYFTFDKPLNPEQEINLFATGSQKLVYFDDFKIIFEY
ncbi:hypothetical protein MASR1M74_25750 [Lentimicrobium sp.]